MLTKINILYYGVEAKIKKSQVSFQIIILSYARIAEHIRLK